MIASLLRLIARLPLNWLQSIGVALGWFVYLASPRYASRLRENLAASGIYTDPRALRRAVRQSVSETGKGAVEVAKIWFGDLEAVLGLVQCDTWKVLEEAQHEARGLIFLSPHLGGFEVIPVYTGQRIAIAVLYRPPRQRWLEPLMLAGRDRSKAQVWPATLPGVRRLYKTLRNGGAVGLLPDQAPQFGEGKWAEFFGRPAYTMTLVRRLQKQTGAAVVFTTAERLPKGKGFRLHFERWRGSELDEREMNRMLERAILRAPTQYLWSYNRYKVPQGADPPPGAPAVPAGR